MAARHILLGISVLANVCWAVREDYSFVPPTAHKRPIQPHAAESAEEPGADGGGEASEDGLAGDPLRFLKEIAENKGAKQPMDTGGLTRENLGKSDGQCCAKVRDANRVGIVPDAIKDRVFIEPDETDGLVCSPVTWDCCHKSHKSVNEKNWPAGAWTAQEIQECLLDMKEPLGPHRDVLVFFEKHEFRWQGERAEAPAKAPETQS
jgi:hypothetical protein